MTWISALWYTLPFSSEWMAWNLFLAVLPFIFSLWLFRRNVRTRSVGWWAVLFLFVAFLPNAPYVLTDLIHLVQEIQGNESLLFNTLVLLPKYAVFVLVGFEAYVLALLNFGNYLKRQGLGSWVGQMELALHALCAIGVYLGRFERFNSWDLMTRPHHVIHSIAETLLDPHPLMFMLLGFGVTAVLYWLMKQITLALMLQREYQQTIERSPNRSNVL